MNIVIGPNFYGAGNFGDDLMLEGFVRAVAGSGLSITALTPHHLESQRERFDAITWLRDEEETRDDAVRRADVWLGVGGTPFQLDSGRWMLDHLTSERERCARYNVPMAFLGVGCESEAAARDARSRELLSAAARIWTRDAWSTEFLRGVAPLALIDTGADLAHLALCDFVPGTVDVGVLGLLVAYEDRALLRARDLDDVIDGRPPGSTRWLVQEQRRFPHTEYWNFDALSETTQQQLVVMPLDYGADTVATYLANFGIPETVVSTRYHGALVAAWRGSRVGVIARSAKMCAIADDLGLAFLEGSTDGAKIEDLMARADVAASDRLASVRARAADMCEDFVAWACGLGVRRPRVSWPVLD